MPRAGLTPDGVVDIALECVGAGEPLTLAAVAARAQVRTPSLYKHVGSLAELQSLVSERVLAALLEHVDSALGDTRGETAARATMDAYRSFASAHPDLYAALPVQPGHDPRLRPLARRLMARIASALGYVDLDDPAALHALRLIRAAGEGFIRLEQAGGFGEPADVDESWRRLMDAVAPVARAAGS